MMLEAALVSWLLLDARTGDVARSGWRDAGQGVPAGSLVKPFMALAWFESQGGGYPKRTCTGARDGCWRPAGHGTIGMAEAVGHSCNAYFRALAARLPARHVSALAARFGLAGPREGASLYGAGGGWVESPVTLLGAYRELIRRAADPGVGALLEGMALAARTGTAAALGDGVLAKTGTAPCTHAKGAGDGFVVVAFPAAAPRGLLLLRVHGTTGARAAEEAARVLRGLRRETGW